MRLFIYTRLLFDTPPKKDSLNIQHINICLKGTWAYKKKDPDFQQVSLTE